MGRLELDMKVIVRWSLDNFRYYVVFHRSILFILGFIFSYKLVEMQFLNILITYLSPPRAEDYDLRKAIILVNLQGGISSVLTIILVFVADAYVGLFKMLLSSSLLCITGLVLTHFAAKRLENRFDDFLVMFYPALVLLTLSQAATMVTAGSFLSDQLTARDEAATAEEEIRRDKLTNFWLQIISLFAAIFVLIGPLQLFELTELARALAIVMGAGFFWFLLGFKLYHHVKPAGSALSDVPLVICNAIGKRNVAYPHSSDQNSSGHVQIPPHIPWLRWLDRAAVVQEKQAAGRICSVEQVKGVKLLLKMVPMWSTFLTFSLVYASGDTLFLEEASSIIDTDDSFPILLLSRLQSLTAVVVSVTSDYVVEKLCEKKNYNAARMMVVRIGIGMLCSVLCCIAAWTQAVHRLDLVDTYGKATNRMSVYRLTPQFLLLGFMEGLSSDGLQNFFESQVSRSMSRFGPPFRECVMGIGKFVTIVCILILSKWIRRGQVDKYYVFLAVLSSVNILVYYLVAAQIWYGDDTWSNDIEMGNPDLQRLVGEEEEGTKSLLLTGRLTFPSTSSRPRGLYNRFHSMPKIPNSSSPF